MEELGPYEYLWTTERRDHALFTVTCYGNCEYLILHKPTKRVSLVCDDALGKRIIHKMIEMGVEVLESPLVN